jgi:hypothetical protein
LDAWAARAAGEWRIVDAIVLPRAANISYRLISSREFGAERDGAHVVRVIAE